MAKNVFMLCLIYGAIVYHYFVDLQIISLPAILMGVYVVNVVINTYEAKFVQFMLELFDMKIAPIQKKAAKFESSLPTI